MARGAGVSAPKTKETGTLKATGVRPEMYEGYFMDSVDGMSVERTPETVRRICYPLMPSQKICFPLQQPAQRQREVLRFNSVLYCTLQGKKEVGFDHGLPACLVILSCEILSRM